ncbi:MAG: hypothetical protein ABUM51_02565 [Bacteroidota bacterium]
MKNLYRSCLFILLPVLFYACSVPEKPVTKEEAMELSRKIERSIVSHNPILLDKIFDEEGFSKRVASGAGPSLNKDLLKGAMEGVRKMHFGQQIVQAVDSEGTYLLVKQYEKDQRQHLVFRLYRDGSVNYHDYELVKREDAIKAIDVFIYMNGEKLSTTLAQALLMVQDKMPDMSKTDLDRINKIKTIKALIAQRDYTKAREYYDEMPDDLKKQKLFQMIHIQIGSGMGDEKYGEAMNEYRALFPNDPNMYLMMIDAYVLEKDYPKALRAVNKLDSFINKDPFQDYYRGLMYKLMKDSLQSRACFERLHAYMPQFSKGTIELIVSYAKTGDMEKAVQLMKQAKGDKTLSPETAQLLCDLHPDLKKAVEADK